MIAGFESLTSGRILLGEQDLTALPPHRRPVNMMFQSYALFPHMSVAGNIGYGLKGLGRAALAERVSELLKLVRLDGFGERRPETLSGGQRQRVALARALAREPKLLLLDEPLGALDRGLREETQGELRAVQRRLGTAFVVVTHDPEEAMMLADRIGVMEAGRLIQVGPPADLYRRPASRFVAGLLGDVNLIPGRLGPAAAPTRSARSRPRTARSGASRRTRSRRAPPSWWRCGPRTWHWARRGCRWSSLTPCSWATGCAGRCACRTVPPCGRAGGPRRPARRRARTRAPVSRPTSR